MYAKYLELKTKKHKVFAQYRGWNPIVVHEGDNKDDNLLLIDYLISTSDYPDTYEINYWIFSDFPKHEYIMLIENFINNGESLHHVCVEYIKLIYNIWNDYMNIPYDKKPKNYPDNEIYELLYTIKTVLNRLPDELNTQKFLWLPEGAKNTRYIFWHWFGLYPLLGKNGLEKLKEVTKVNYGDGQDAMMFGIYQIDPFKNFDVVLDILEYWHLNQNVPYCSGTGMSGQLKLTLDKYDKIGFDFRNNKKIIEILEAEKVDYN